MSKKRFIDISTLPKTWRKLDSNLKLTWYWLWNNCDPSGVWEIDEDFFEFENGFEIDTSSLTKALPNEIEASNGKVLLKNYIVVNYCDFSKLNENYNPHKPLFRSIKKNNLKLQPSLNQACFKLVDVDEEEEEKEGMGNQKIEIEDNFKQKIYDFFSLTSEDQKIKSQSFFRTLNKRGCLEEFKKQTEAYIEYKTKSDEKIHGWSGYQANWDMSDWSDKLKKLNLKTEPENQVVKTLNKESLKNKIASYD